MSQRSDLPLVMWSITIPKPLAEAFERVHWDHVYNKPQYGAKVRVITALLVDYLREKGGGDKELEELLSDAGVDAGAETSVGQSTD